MNEDCEHDLDVQDIENVRQQFFVVARLRHNQRTASYLLPPPGGEVVRSLLDELDKYEQKMKAMRALVREAHKDAFVFAIHTSPAELYTHPERGNEAIMWEHSDAKKALDKLDEK